MWGPSIGLAVLAIFMISHMNTAASAQHDVDDWQFRKIVYPLNGAFLGCMISKNHATGVTVYFMLTRKGYWQMHLSNKNWNLVKGRPQKVALIVDEHAPLNVRSFVRTTQYKVMPLLRSPRFIDNLQRGKVLRVKTQDGELALGLEGPFLAIKTVRRCLANAVGVAQKPESNASASTEELSRAEATEIVTQLLEAADLRGVRLVHPVHRMFDVAWKRHDGIMGAFKGWRTTSAQRLDSAASLFAANLFTALMAAGCKVDVTMTSEPSADNQKLEIKQTSIICNKRIKFHATLAWTASAILYIFHLFPKKYAQDDVHVAEADLSFMRIFDWSWLD